MELVSHNIPTDLIMFAELSKGFIGHSRLHIVAMRFRSDISRKYVFRNGILVDFPSGSLEYLI